MPKQAKISETEYIKIVGKTVMAVDATAVNVLKIHFEDGSCLELETNHVGHGIYGIQPKLTPGK